MSLPKTDIAGVLALELRAGSLPGQAALSLEQAERLAAQIGQDLAVWAPLVREVDLVLAAAHFDPAEALRPGWPLHRRLHELHARAPGGRHQPARILALGRDADDNVPLPLQSDRHLHGGALRIVPFLLSSTNIQQIQAVGDTLEAVLLANGMAGADTALLAQSGFAAEVEHARYLTLNDLTAMTAMQYQHRGLDCLWPLLETALFSPKQSDWLDKDPEPLLYYTGDQSVRLALFDWENWCLYYGHPVDNPTPSLQQHWQHYQMRQRQLIAVLNTHGLDVYEIPISDYRVARVVLAQTTLH